MTKLILLLFLLLSACKQKEFIPAVDETKNIKISGFELHQQNKNPVFYDAVESSIVLLDNKPTYLLDFGMSGSLSINNKVTEVNSNRFAYVTSYNNTFYKFIWFSNAIYMQKSTDLITWIPMHNNRPVLTNSVYKEIWNVGVAINGNDLYLLVEASNSGNENAGLAYATATFDDLDFDKTLTRKLLIEKAGNPWLGYIPGKGLIAIYGKQLPTWGITAATFDGTAWTEHLDFLIVQDRIPLCDPHVLETNNGFVLSFSYNQESIYEMVSSESIEQLFDRIK